MLEKDLKQALKKMRCKLTPAQIFDILGFNESELVDWQKARIGEDYERGSSTKGILFLTRNDLFFIPKATWPGRTTEKLIERMFVKIPISEITKIKTGKRLLSRKTRILNVKGEISKRRILSRKKKKGTEIFFLEEGAGEFANKIKKFNPDIKS